MFRKFQALVFINALIIIALTGCALKEAFFSKEVPPLEGYSKIVIAPFDVKKPTGKYSDVPVMLSYGIGTKLSIRFKEKGWFYDQSKDLTPVSDKMKELNIPLKDLYQNPQSAVNLAKAFDADLIIVGLMSEPNFTIERSGKIEYEMSESTPTGAARYYSVYQTATLRTKVRVIEVASGKVIWEGDLVGFRKYKTRYRTGESEKKQREETMLADIRKDFVDNFVAKLYPEKVAK